MSFDASGLYSLASEFKAAPAKVRDLTGQVVRKSAADVENYAKQAAPVDTGNLRASIGVEMTGSFDAAVGPTANYGVFVETGTSRMGPQPYMRPAIDRVEPAFVAAMGKVADL